MAKRIIGIDVGGTKISVVLGDAQGKIYDKKMFYTRKNEETKLCIREILDTINLLVYQNGLKISDIAGIGVGLPGPVDPEKGFVGPPPNLPGWEKVKIKSIIKNKFRRPVFINNDANLAALSEKVFGQGKTAKNFIYITVSTGIGGGIVIDYKLHEGSSFSAGEIGHMTIFPGGLRCGCGKSGCLEAYASGTAIASQAIKQIKAGASSKLVSLFPDINKIGGREVNEAAKEGDKLAISVIRNAGHFLGIGIANLINILNPDLIILGGSVIKAGKIYWQPMTESVKKNAWPTPLAACKIVQTKLGDKVTDLGAISLVVSNLKK